MSTQQPLDGRVAIVTGASRGIGAATARALHRAGAAVVLAARDADALHTLAAEIEADGGRALAVPTDVTDAAAVERMVDATLDRFGHLDAAVNNAAGGGHSPTPLAEVDIADFDSALAVNLRGVFLAMKYEIPAMLDWGAGTIVNMSSTAGLQAVGGLTGYVSAKFGLIGLTRTAALDYADRGIRVNALAPGPIHTEQLEAAGEQARQAAAQAMPMRRIGLPEEVAAAVVWLCSDESSFITGATLPIDGGKLAGSPPFRRPTGGGRPNPTAT
ncbi:SDR family NAD(P)-dependent oxidoreductase [Embleya scabrispora]|uniref:SDR family NAD(P)-dependent oxidoreductase n=1 Tax=Embleya scabrispora TaxID=159449 RepID=UPI000371095B|nr:SDR family NAD(P)-dependent oxidoreductase [Embleya scabrispora]MYS84997.1 glucose 1-dehydrogenase [Streptomyces sp. SID5474]